MVELCELNLVLKLKFVVLELGVLGLAGRSLNVLQNLLTFLLNFLLLYYLNWVGLLHELLVGLRDLGVLAAVQVNSSG